MKQKKWLKKLLCVTFICVGAISLTLFLGFQKHTVDATIISCTAKNIQTEKRTYRFIPEWGWEPYKILIVDVHGAPFDSATSSQICDGQGKPIYDIRAIEYNGFGYITALHVSYKQNLYPYPDAQ